MTRVKRHWNFIELDAAIASMNKLRTPPRQLELFPPKIVTKDDQHHDMMVYFGVKPRKRKNDTPS